MPFELEDQPRVVISGWHAGFAATLIAVAAKRLRLDPDDERTARRLIDALTEASLRGSDSGTSEQVHAEPRAESAGDEYFTVSELAEALDVSTSLVRRWCRDGQLPDVVRPSGRWLIPAEVAHVAIAARTEAA